jgi:tRNA nucleotidyltransferase (CCA-adding enzyme)
MASSISPPPRLVLDVARAIRLAGGRALIVGGWVRDQLLGLASGAVDLEVYGVGPDTLRHLLETFGRVDAVGESFTVYKVAGLDVALPRTESKTGRGHRGFEVIGDPDLSCEQAVRRRDYTVNALMFDPLTGTLIDLVGGQRDLEERLLRAVDASTFGDDSLRVLRGLQFAARFGMSMDAQTRALCATTPLDDLASERVWGEFEKLLRAPRPSIGFALGLDIGVVHSLFPELATLVGCPQEPDWHPEGDVWVHTLLVIDRARTMIDDLTRGQALAVMLGAVCHDVGKPITTAVIDGRVRSPNHEPEGVGPATAFLDRLNVRTIDGYDARKQVLGMVQYHLAPGMWHRASSPVSDGAFRRLAQKVDLELLARLARADCEGRTGDFDCSAMDWFLDRARALGVEHRAPAPILMGRHLLSAGVSPGPRLGQILRVVYERQLDGAVTSVEDGLALASALLNETAGT